MSQKITPPPPLYRGGREPVVPDGNITRGNPDEHGNLVYASPYFWHAAVYGLKQRAESSSIRFVSLGESFFSFIVMSADLKDKDYFQKLIEGRTYVAKVPENSFTIHKYGGGTPDGYLPIEWASKTAVEALEVEEIPNHRLLRNGIQVFTGDIDTLEEKFFSKGSPYKEIKKLVQSGDLYWENSRYSDEPEACPPLVCEYFGLNPDKQSVRPTFSPRNRAHISNLDHI